HAEIVVDNAKVSAETKAYKKIPVIADFTDDAGNDVMQQVIEHNYNQIKADVKQIVADELARIENDPDLQHLIKKE
ncbi:MAG: conjugal transfer protein TraG, partial [Prevotellaceae bacterium]|nr:conjugal transfer protein TraG [Prevotellaceae bacterium]